MVKKDKSIIFSLKRKKLKRFFTFITLLIILGSCLALFFKLSNFVKTIPISTIIIQGASPEVTTTIQKELIFLQGKNITNVNLINLQKYLQQMPWVYKVSIYRNLTGIIKINVIEKNPYFLWLNDTNVYQLIDSDNKVSKNKLNFDLRNLIVIEKGKTALDNFSHLRFVIYKDLSILKKIKKLSFNGYRWDIHLKNGIIIKLPEENLDQAYDRIIRAHKKYNILNKQIDYVDSTVTNKLFIMPTPPEQNLEARI
ncbi:Cell division protein FtsQ [Candidatus Hepatincolaceae symbiont of Richtersius coronifer]